MPRPKGTGKGESDRFIIRVPMETAAFYRRKANENGVSAAQFLRNMIEKGILAEDIQEIEERLKDTVAKIDAQETHGQALPEYLIHAILMSQQLLRQIVEQRDVGEYYRAQDAVQLTMKREV